MLAWEVFLLLAYSLNWNFIFTWMFMLALSFVFVKINTEQVSIIGAMLVLYHCR